MAKPKRSRAGNATIEFTLVGIPLVFVLISTIEMARGMWIYHTLAYSIKEGTRYAVGRGQNSTGTNHATYQGVCNAILSAGTGLAGSDLKLTFLSYLVASSSSPSGRTFHNSTGAFNADTCSPPGHSPTDPWPPGISTAQIDDQPGQTISITGTYPFASAISMFWPGAGPGVQFAPLTFRADSQDVMQF
jgi:hypothetical protein